MKKEEILLDAELISPLSCATFQARLDNGHEIVAFPVPKKPASELGLKPGMRVRVEISPYDMQKGKIILHPQGSQHESS